MNMEIPQGPPVDLLEKLEKELERVRKLWNDMETDRTSSKYPNGVPHEYHAKMDQLQRDANFIEDTLKRYKNNK